VGDKVAEGRLDLDATFHCKIPCFVGGDSSQVHTYIHTQIKQEETIQMGPYGKRKREEDPLKV
jgi:hypothetical protein